MYIYTSIYKTDPFCCIPERNKTISQLYSNKKKFKKPRM